jgi:RHS repeat-associated protein
VSEEAQGAGPLPSPSLPKGGGAIRSIGEKFGVSPSRGTGNLTIPIAVSTGRAGFGPQLELAYDSGAGNGPFGLGWQLSLPAISRKTDKGLPRYRDHDAESDVFVLSGGEDLVVAGDEPRTLHGVRYRVIQYRPRIDSAFARIERWMRLDTGVSHFRTITRDNVTTLYGLDEHSRIADPDDPRAVFSYLICRSFDDKGNAVRYRYLAEDDVGVDRSRAHEATRVSRTAQRYLKEIEYGNVTPYYPVWSEHAPETPLPDAWHFRVVFDYGDHALETPVPVPDRAWPVRPDPISDRRAGFEVRSYRRCHRILMFHDFASEPEVGVDCLVRSTDLRYSDQEAAPDPRAPIYTCLTSIVQTGYRRTETGYVARSVPPLELAYSRAEIRDELNAVADDHLPEGIDGVRYQWVDLDGEGLSGVLAQLDGGWYYRRNLSPLGGRPRFGPLQVVPGMPVTGDHRLLDLSGDGQLDVVSLDRAQPGFFARTASADWEPFRTFAALPEIPWAEPNLRLIDVTGDGLADAVLTESGAFTIWPSIGKDGFAQAERVPTAWDEQRGPAVVLADGTESIFVADMTGDGLADLVRVRAGEVCYWPNLGYGRFGAKVTMDDAPRFSDEARFDPQRVRLADIDGSGTADLLYVADDGVHVCFNCSGNAWAEPRRLAVFPGADAASSVQVFDLLGTGTACLVWSSPLPGHTTRPLRYVELMTEKPHLLTRTVNNLGGETVVSYAPSTRFYLADELAGRPWITRLPHIVHVVERVETEDRITGSRFVSRYTYRHGYFDGPEREFRGFGMVEQRDTEEYDSEATGTNWDAASWSPPVVTRTWFHTGAFGDVGSVSRHYEHEYWTESGVDHGAGARLPDSVIDGDLTAGELRQAYRALKGQTLRTEVFAEDGSARAASPYVVTEHNFTVEMIQAAASGGGHAVFATHPRESVSLHYERDAGDPRVTHQVTLETDRFGNVLRSVEIGYGRRAPPRELDLALSQRARDMLAYDQGRLHVVAHERRFTNDLTDPARHPDVHRTPLLAGSRDAEWTGIAPASSTNLFAFGELDALWASFDAGAADVPYEDVPRSDVDGAGQPAVRPTRRITGETRQVYRRDDLAGLLPPGQLEALALPGESYQLALTSGLRARVLGDLVSDLELTRDGGYVAIEGGWWIRSGHIAYSATDTEDERQEARAHFFLPRRLIDAFGAESRVDYTHDLLVSTAIDPVGNATVIENDLRVLQPRAIVDANGNRGEVAFDALGLVIATAVSGKAGEGDALAGFVADLADAAIAAHFADPLADPAALVGDATTRLVYDLSAYRRTGGAPVVHVLARETHASDGETRYHHTLTYSDGLGREIQTKQAAPAGQWITSGWTVLDNKGRPVRTYEPFYSPTHQLEVAREAGVSIVRLYDSADRVVATVHPNGTWEKVVFDPWHQAAWDVNDTVAIADPRSDPDVGDRFRRLLGADPAAWRSWHDLRIGGARGAAEQAAAQATEAHAGTPTSTYFDALGRPCLVVADNGNGERHATRTALDLRGKPLAVFDPLGRRVFEYCLREPDGAGVRYLAGYDLLGNPLYHHGMDGGERRGLLDVAGKQIRARDARGRTFEVRYDRLRRPTHRFVSEGGTRALLDRSIYGEGMADQNLCGRLFRHYDPAGLASNDRFDFKGNLVATTRQLAIEYRDRVDWSALADLEEVSALDAAARPLLSDVDRFTSTTTYDALNRAIQTVTPHDATMLPNVIRPGFDEAGRIVRIDVWSQRAAAPAALLDPATADLHVLTGATYNARGQQTTATFGNTTITTREFDPMTFRLARLTTTRPGFPADKRVVQDLTYVHDPAGNVTHIQDDADLQNVIYFLNRRVEPSNNYTYDATYRLIRATGREHLGQAPPRQYAHDDAPRTNLAHPGDGQAMARYEESYRYDATGNLVELVHDVASQRWTRHYAYDEPSSITALETCNRLSATSLPGDPSAGPYGARYAHDAHGNVTRMPHLPAMTWDDQDCLRSTTRQRTVAATPETTFYTYDDQRQRCRKVTDGQAAAGELGRRVAERIYLGPVELYREYGSDGRVTLQRETLHVTAGEERIAIVEDRPHGTDRGSSHLVRYQYGNHLGSVCLELRASGDDLTYEEYAPYGSTTYQAIADENATPKRYRFTGKERDDETALAYHGARYYAPWLGRWTATDPAGLVDGPNLYAYVGNKPIGHRDPDGRRRRAAGDSPGEPQSSAIRVSPQVGYAAFGVSPRDVLASELNRVTLAGALAAVKTDAMNVNVPVHSSIREDSKRGVWDAVKDFLWGFVYNPDAPPSETRQVLVRTSYSVSVATVDSEYFERQYDYWVTAAPTKTPAAVRAGAWTRTQADTGLLVASIFYLPTQVETMFLRGHMKTALKQFGSEGWTTNQLRWQGTPRWERLHAAWRGDRIDSFFKLGVASDYRLNHLDITKRFKFGPDVFRPGKHVWWDVTTEKGWAGHGKYKPSFGRGIPLLYDGTSLRPLTTPSAMHLQLPWFGQSVERRQRVD